MYVRREFSLCRTLERAAFVTQAGRADASLEGEVNSRRPGLTCGGRMVSRVRYISLGYESQVCGWVDHLGRACKAAII